MQKNHAKAVLRTEALETFPVGPVVQAAVGQHAVHIGDHQTDATQTLFQRRHIGSVIRISSLQQGAYSLQILFRIHTRRAGRQFHHLYADAVLQKAQLLQFFRALQFSGSMGGKDGQRRRAVGIHAHMPPVLYLLFAIPIIGNGRAAEIKRLPCVVAYDLNKIGIERLPGADGITGSRGRHMRIVTQRFYQFVYVSRTQQRFVPLHIQVDVRLFVTGDFHESVGPGGAVRRSHDGVSAKIADGPYNTFIVRGNKHIVHQRSPADGFTDMLNHGLAAYVQQRFARQAG